MKKYLLALISLCFIVSCDKDDPTPPPPVPQVTFLDCLVNHKWVYDHPNIPTWEEWNVFDDGVMYYSNSTSFIYTFTNKDVKCRYVYNRDNGAFLIQTESLGTVEGVISKWDKYEFTWKTNDGSFSYNCLLETDTIDKGATFEPSYSKLISDATISNYSSHNTTIADVDASGKIIAKGQGRTYIDVVTDKGTAVIEVFVKNFTNYNYEDFLGVYKYDLVKTFEGLYITEGDDIIYDYSRGSLNEANNLVKDLNWERLQFRLDPSTDLVKAVSLLAKEDVWFTPDEMTDYLSKRFHTYKEGTTADVKAFTNAETLEEASVGITWNTKDRILTYVRITHKSAISEIDFGDYLGKNKAEVKDLMKGYSVTTESNTNISFAVGSNYVKMVKFTLDAAAEPAIVKQVDVYLNSDIDQAFVKSEIEKKYKYYGGVEGDYFDYFSDDMKTRVVYNIHYNVIQFIKRK